MSGIRECDEENMLGRGEYSFETIFPCISFPLIFGIIGLMYVWTVTLNTSPPAMSCIHRLKHGESCRVKTCDLSARTSAYTLKTDHAYWRAYEVKRENGEWLQRVFAEP